ncbi:hypothetical protein ES703_109172 [subsurface metagenome]
MYDGGVPSASVWSYGTDLKGLPRYGIAVVEESGKIYAFGGAPDDVRVDCYDPALDTWSSKGDAAGDINYSAANSVAGLIYIGYMAGAIRMREYDPALDAWGDLAMTAFQVANVQGGVVGTDIYYFDYNGRNLCAEYATVGDVWDATLNLAANRHEYGASGVIAGLYYMAYGMDGARNLKCDEYDPVGLAWANKNDGPAPARAKCVGIAIGGVLYVAGGDTAAGVENRIKDLDAYDQGTGLWSSKEDMPLELSNIETSAAVESSKGYLCGGSGDAVVGASKYLLIFDPAEVYVLWSGTLNVGDAIAIYRPGGTTKIYADGKVYNLTGSGCVFPIFTAACPVRVTIPYTDDYTEIEVWTGEVS